MPTTATPAPKLNLTEITRRIRTHPHERAALIEQARALARPKSSAPTSLAPVVQSPAIPRGFRLDPLIGLIKIEPNTATPEPPPSAPPMLTVPVPAVDDALLEAVATVAQRVASATGTAFAESEEAEATLERLVSALDDGEAERVSLLPGVDFGRYAAAVPSPFGALAPRVAVVLHRHGRERAPGVPLSPDDADAGMIVSEWLRRRRTPPPAQLEPVSHELTLDFDGVPVESLLEAEAVLSSVRNFGHSETAPSPGPAEEPVAVANEALPVAAPADDRWTRLGSIVESSGGRVTAGNLRRLGFEVAEVHALIREHPGSDLTLTTSVPKTKGDRTGVLLVRRAP